MSCKNERLISISNFDPIKKWLAVDDRGFTPLLVDMEDPGFILVIGWPDSDLKIFLVEMERHKSAFVDLKLFSSGDVEGNTCIRSDADRGSI
jgi:hypothetical protein